MHNEQYMNLPFSLSARSKIANEYREDFSHHVSKHTFLTLLRLQEFAQFLFQKYSKIKQYIGVLGHH